MKENVVFFLSAALAMGLGSAFALGNETLSAPVKAFSLIEPYGQDIDGDGQATTIEGSFDVDGDGKFGEAEKRELGLEFYIRWAYPDDLLSRDFTSEIRHCASACLSGSFGFSCQPNLVSVNCIEGNPCQTVACSFPCICPPK